MKKKTTGLLALAALVACQGEPPVSDASPSEPAAAPAAESRTLPHPGEVFVHLFEWSWPSIAKECEDFLAPAGYSAVQVSPPQEHAQGQQWWTRYQPVSYQLVSRGGTREQFVDMVDRCAAVGVDIYVDAVINHMTGVYAGTGTAGTEFSEYEYPPLYSYDDFHHCGRHDGDDIADFNDVWELHHCELVNLADLKTGDPEVQAKLAGYLNDLLGIGVAGFRIDAAKHMPAEDIAAVMALLDADAFVFQEVIAEIDGPLDRSAYTRNAHVTEFQYQPPLHRAFGGAVLDDLERLGPDIGLLPSNEAVVFVDNHDTQRHGEGQAFNYKVGERYVLANVFMLAWPYGYPKVMSSFEFEDTEAGAPGIEPVADGSCNDGWVCEHRTPAIANLVGFRSATAGSPVTHWQEHGDTALSFGRGDRGHVVINLGESPIEIDVRTNLPAGDYCDLVSGGIGCTEASAQVTGDGSFIARVPPMMALAILRSE